MPNVNDAYEHAFAHVWAARELTPAAIDALVEDTKRALIRAAIDSKVAAQEDQLTIRPILPNLDLSLTNESWVTPSLTTVAYTQIVSKAITTPFCLGFYGAFFWGTNSPPKVSILRYREGASGAGSTRFIFSLQKLMAEQQQVGYHPPVIYTPGNTCYIDGYNWDAAAATEKMGLLGWVAEPRGAVMNGRTV